KRYNFKGIIDRLMLTPDGAFEVHDYKTSSGLPDQTQVDSDRQLALYQVGVQTLWPESQEVRLVWHYVAFDMEMRSARTPEALEALKTEIMALIDRVEEAKEFEPCESPLCDWCPYWDLCPVKKHLVKVEGLPADEWKDEPGVKIVDAYADKWRQKRELEAEQRTVDGELEQIREAAIAFAEREEVQVIAGTTAKLRVTGKDRIVSPAKGSDEREKLENELRALGVWDEVAMLDPFALEKAVAEGHWKSPVVERIQAYVKTEKRYTVTLKEDREPGAD
ncbi:MAG: PD-(D/E)XK nuclease family protein, partial [Candidatus Aminicenantes bacterium]|nr:PD-(D/E)XK nuclease family protein [Candidatus Aminicenantes bacterium]